MGNLKRIYAHRELKKKFIFNEEEVNQRDDKELISETSFLYDEETKLVYCMANGADKPELYQSLFGDKYHFIDNEIILAV